MLLTRRKQKIKNKEKEFKILTEKKHNLYRRKITIVERPENKLHGKRCQEKIYEGT